MVTPMVVMRLEFDRSQCGEENFLGVHWKYVKDGMGNEEGRKVSVEYSLRTWASRVSVLMVTKQGRVDIHRVVS